VHVNLEVPPQLLDAVIGDRIGNQDAFALGAHPITFPAR